MLAVITGASGAIGEMCAYEAARLGYDIILCCNSNTANAGMFENFPVKVCVVHADITTKEGRAEIENAARSMGGTDILVNNAGIAQIKPFLDTDECDTQDIVGTDLCAMIDLTRLIIPQMLKKRGGAIVNISSVWGVTGASCEVIYSGAKAGVIGFTKSLAKELAPSNITVNAVAPGCIQSKMLDGLDTQQLCDMIPLSRLGDGLEVAKAVFFLARHGYITGQTLNVDGGMVI